MLFTARPIKMSASSENKISSHSSNFSSTLGSKIASAKLFVVGAGGIGCELLKNLVLVGFKNIHVVSRQPCYSILIKRDQKNELLINLN